MKKFFVKVFPNVNNFEGEGYPLKAVLLDEETREPLDQDVTFRDMGHVRSYYNGMLAGWGRIIGYSHGVQLTTFGMHRATALYENPVNMRYEVDANCMVD